MQQGSIHRGDLTRIRAVVWVCDLRSFTPLSEQLEPEGLIEVLGAYFELVGEAIEANGGEILKFAGDAVLAMFPCADGGEDRGTVERALRAAEDAIGRAGSANERRASDGRPPLRFGIGLHLGNVVYGNIGTPTRLDFTVIGQAVNLAHRVEGQCAPLREPLLVTEAVARASGTALRDLGEHAMRGVREPQRLYGLPKGPWPSAEGPPALPPEPAEPV